MAQLSTNKETNRAEQGEDRLPELIKREYSNYTDQVDDFLVQRQEQLIAVIKENTRLKSGDELQGCGHPYYFIMGDDDDIPECQVCRAEKAEAALAQRAKEIIQLKEDNYKLHTRL